MNRLPGRGRLSSKAALAGLAVALAGWSSLVLPSPAVAVETGYNPNGLPVASCFWTGPFTRSDPRTNVAYPGTEITYWGAKFITPPGAVLTLKGRFPYARYSSLNAYTDNGVSTSSLSDTRIRPDAGSINPSIPGKDRLAKKRRYTVSVVGEPLPASPARNTLYAAPVAGAHQDILYRVYIPDKGRDLSGDTGLPTPSLRLQDGTVLAGEALCEAMNSIHDYTNQLLPEGVYKSLLLGKGPEQAATNPAMPTLAFGKYFNLPTSLARYLTTEELEAAWELNPDYEGTQYDNSDARYMTAAYSFAYGETLALRGRLPTTPTTLRGNRRTKRGQLVAWDMCVVQSLLTTKTWKCVFDEQLPLRSRKRDYLILISKREQRPANAVRKCGVYWLEADPEGDGYGRDVGQLLTRNVLPAKDFTRSSWAVKTPFAAEAASKMGPYYPRGEYMSKKRFERLGCLRKGKKKSGN